MRVTTIAHFDFELPTALAAAGPPEARGLSRSDVRLLVSRARADRVVHAHFRQLPEFLGTGDVLVVNASATINAAFDAWRVRGAGLEHIELHLSSVLPDGKWSVELRRIVPDGHSPLLDARPGERLALVAGASATLIEPIAGRRLWSADLEFPGGVLAFATHHGFPIRYNYVRERWPISYYQTVFATEPGSVEMPSAARAFTAETIEALEQAGVSIVPLVLHTGVSSLEADEPPYAEQYHVPEDTARAVNDAHGRGRRVIAVGTTVARALETVASADGSVHGGAGWTRLVITPERGVRAIDGLLTGFHAPRATHLAMLEAVAGRKHLETAYEAALRVGYRWHEFGDLHLILPS